MQAKTKHGLDCDIRLFVASAQPTVIKLTLAHAIKQLFTVLACLDQKSTMQEWV